MEILFGIFVDPAVPLLVVVTFVLSMWSATGTWADASLIAPNNVECQGVTNTQWSSNEKSIWLHICLGQDVDLTTLADSLFKKGGTRNGTCDRRDGDHWPQSQHVSAAFLEDILTNQPFVTIIARRGLRIRCAKFRDRPDLSHAKLPGRIWLIDSIYDKGIDLSDTLIDGSMSLTGSRMNGTLDATRVNVAGNLLLNRFTLQRGSVKLVGARIDGDLLAVNSEFSGNFLADRMQVKGGLFLNEEGKFGKQRSRFMRTIVDGSVELRGASIARSIVAVNSVVRGNVEADGLTVEGNIFIGQGTRIYGDVNVLDGKVVGSFVASGTEFGALFRGDRLTIGGALLLRGGSIFKDDVRLRGVRVDGSFDASASTFFGGLRAGRMRVGGRTLLSNYAYFEDTVELVNARIDGGLTGTDSYFAGGFRADGIDVKGDLLLDGNPTFKEDLRLAGAEIHGQLKLGPGSYHGRVNLMGSRVHGILVLGAASHDCPKWFGDSIMSLRNMTVDAIQDRECWWDDLTDRIELTGFQYKNFVPFRDQTMNNKILPQREIDELKKWLEKSLEFNLQPYQQLASVLRRYGHDDKADEIMITGLETRPDSDGSWFDWLTTNALWLLQYGYAYERSIYCFLILVLGGTILGWMGMSTRERRNVIRWYMFCRGFWYSVDRAVPLIELDPKHKTVKLPYWCKYYFYGHRIVGFILVSIFIAGATGLIK